jgi:hypothetical protein
VRLARIVEIDDIEFGTDLILIYIIRHCIVGELPVNDWLTVGERSENGRRTVGERR